MGWQDRKPIGDDTRIQSRLNRSRGWLVWVAVLGTLIGLTALLRDWDFYAFTSPVGNNVDEQFAQSQTLDNQKQHSHQPENYILDPNWDFDAPSQRRVYNWTVHEKEHNPDGIFRTMILINNHFPGPMIEANEGDTIVINIENKASNATSIHFHGLYQNGTNHMDGTVGVTQCPVPSDRNFTYEFRVSGQSGTYWYHSHVSAQASDGLFGPFVVHSRSERALQELGYSSDRVIMVSDHYYELSSVLLMEYLASDRENVEPVPDTALVNGKNVRDCESVSGRRCDNTTTNVAIPRLELQANQRHRLRIINTGALAEFQVSFDELEFAITEVDGTDVHPETFHRLNVLPAQRYSVVVDVGESHPLWLRAKMIPTCFAEKNPVLQDEARAILSIGNAVPNEDNSSLPSSKDWDDVTDLVCKDMNTSALVPVQVVEAPSKADTTFYLRSNFEIGAWRLSRGFFNHSSFRPDLKSPSLHRTLDGLLTGNSSFERTETASINDAAFHERQELVIQTRGIQVLDIIVSNFDDGNHPLHLHGYKFFVLAQGHGYPPDNLTESLDLSNPLRRDTATVEAFGWMMLRVVADNPGIWAFHCHLTWHSEAGLMMQFLTRAENLSPIDVPEEHMALCASPLAQLSKGATPGDDVFQVEE